MRERTPNESVKPRRVGSTLRAASAHVSTVQPLTGHSRGPVSRRNPFPAQQSGTPACKWTPFAAKDPCTPIPHCTILESSCLRRNRWVLSREVALTLWQPGHPTVIGRYGPSGRLAGSKRGREASGVGFRICPGDPGQWGASAVRPPVTLSNRERRARLAGRASDASRDGEIDAPRSFSILTWYQLRRSRACRFRAHDPERERSGGRPSPPA